MSAHAGASWGEALMHGDAPVDALLRGLCAIAANTRETCYWYGRCDSLRGQRAVATRSREKC